MEPLYNKVSDFALEFYADGAGGVRYTGLSVFLTTARGNVRRELGGVGRG